MRHRSRLNYSEGTCFLVPLRNGGFARGVVARLDGKGLVFGYFFGPRLSSREEGTIHDLTAHRAILLGKFGDLSLMNGSWPSLGRLEKWKSEEWSMPPLIRIDELAAKATLSHYDDRTFECISEKEVSPAVVNNYPYDRTMGAGAVEIRLSKLLSGESPDRD